MGPKAKSSTAPQARGGQNAADLAAPEITSATPLASYSAANVGSSLVATAAEFRNFLWPNTVIDGKFIFSATPSRFRSVLVP